MEIDSKPAETGDTVGGVGDPYFPVESQRVRGQRGEYRRFDFGTVERSGFELAHMAFEAQARWSVGNEQQIAATLLDESGEPAVEAAGGGGIRESYVAIVVEVADNAIEFRGFGHADSICAEQSI